MPSGSVVNWKDVKDSHKRFLAANDYAISRALDPLLVVPEVQSHVGNGILLARRSGNLVKQTKGRVIRTANRSVIRITNTAKYANAQEHGSGLYGPKRAKYVIRGNPYLSFYWHRKRTHMIVSKVMHPGVKPTHFLQVATNLVFQRRLAALRNGINSAARQF